jgi:hypothetical protein
MDVFSVSQFMVFFTSRSSVSKIEFSFIVGKVSVTFSFRSALFVVAEGREEETKDKWYFECTTAKQRNDSLHS